jgi:very-short-patch-repair endonuclease
VGEQPHEMALRPRTRLARQLRRKATDAEQRLWFALRDAHFSWRFRRQHPIGKFVADFACPARKLVVELDGGQHADRVNEDAIRTAELGRYGYRVLRFWNNDVLTNTDGVLQVIGTALEAVPHLTPTLSAPGGGEGDC